jgi:hypothetical protein
MVNWFEWVVWAPRPIENGLCGLWWPSQQKREKWSERCWTDWVGRLPEPGEE